MGGIIGNGRLVVSAHSLGRLVCSNDNTLSVVDTKTVLTVFPNDVKLTQGMWCFEITVVSTGGSARAGFGFFDELSLSSRENDASFYLPVSDLAQPADIFRFTLDISTLTMTVVHKKLSDDETKTYAVSRSAFGTRALCPFVSFQQPFKLRFNLGHQPFSTAFICHIPHSPPVHSVAHFIRTSVEKDFVRSCAPFGRYTFPQTLTCRIPIDFFSYSEFTLLFVVRFGVLNPISAAEHVAIAPRTRGHEWTFTCKEGAFPTVILDGVLLTSGRWCSICCHVLFSRVFIVLFAGIMKSRLSLWEARHSLVGVTCKQRVRTCVCQPFIYFRD
jgi:hypothetical protein